jgi:uncharacterized membrane protein YcaP (DUF421 family)
LHLERSRVFENQIPLVEVVVRVSLIYAALLVFMRFAGKREVGQLGPLDFLAMLLLSETVSPALTAQDTSLPAALVAAVTLLVLTAVVGRLTYHSPTAERLIDGTPVRIIEHGRIVEEALRRERISPQELAIALRKEGVESPREVERAYVEPTGRITVLRRRERREEAA